LRYAANGGSAPDLVFKNDGSSEIVRFKNGGDVGIGTDSPDRKLDVSGTGNVYGKFQSTNATGAGIELKDTSENWLIQADGGIGSLAFFDWNDSKYRMHIMSGDNESGAFRFSSTTNNGDVWFKWYENGFAGGVREMTIDSGNYYWYFKAFNGAAHLTIASDGTVSGELNDTSDIAFKKNITTLTSGLDNINALNPVNFTWKANIDRGDGTRKSMGFIAQEVETVLPDIVNGEDYDPVKKDEGKSIHTGGLVAQLVKAVQELSAKVEALENA
jgi:hypothetical protein